MSYDFDQFRQFAQAVGKEHREAIDACEKAGKAVANAEKTYRALLSRAVTTCKEGHGATIAETLAKGEDDVAQAKELLTVAEAEDRAAVQRVRLAEADRSVLLTMGSWSKSQEKDW